MKSVFFRLVTVVIFLIFLLALILYARGYRVGLSQKNLVATGILVASSYPDGAKIYVNGQLKGATNSNLSLSPGTYLVEIKKDGYYAWSKNLTIRGEIVVDADALLLPQNPSLSPLTSLGIVKAHFSEKYSQVVIFSQIGDQNKDGVYLLETSKKPLSIFNPLKLLVLKSALPPEIDLSQARVRFSPDGKEILLSFYQLRTNLLTASYLLPTSDQTKELFAITKSQAAIETAWRQQEEKKLQKILETFKPPIGQIASESFDTVSFSPDESKILYLAKTDRVLPPVIQPPLIGTNQTPQQRNVQRNHLYVYDKKEDKNFFIENCGLKIENCILWYPDSAHLVINQGETISVVDYDGTNKRTVYSGPYDKEFLSITTDGNILILTSLNQGLNTLPDVYAVGLK